MELRFIFQLIQPGLYIPRDPEFSGRDTGRGMLGQDQRQHSRPYQSLIPVSNAPNSQGLNGVILEYWAPHAKRSRLPPEDPLHQECPRG